MHLQGQPDSRIHAQGSSCIQNGPRKTCGSQGLSAHETAVPWHSICQRRKLTKVLPYELYKIGKAPQAYKTAAVYCKAILICFLTVLGGGGVAEAKIRVEARRALTCDDQTVGSVMCAVY